MEITAEAFLIMLYEMAHMLRSEQTPSPIIAQWCQITVKQTSNVRIPSDQM